MLEFGTHCIAIEIKRSQTSRPTREFHLACNDIPATARWLVHGGERSFPLPGDILALPLVDAIERLRAMERH